MFFIIAIVTNHVVEKQFLPNRLANLFCNDPFQLLHHTRNCRGDHWSSVFIRANHKQQMNMIRHNNVFINLYSRINS